MASCFQRSSVLTGVASVDVAAPPEIVWSIIICDLDAIPSIISCVVSVERIGGGSTFEVGTKWREIRCYSQAEFVIYKTITAIDDDRYEVHFDSNFKAVPHKRHRDATSTNTLTVEKTDYDGDKNSCRLIGTFAFDAASVWTKMRQVFCGYCWVKPARNNLQIEMEEYAAAAEKKFQQKTV